MHCLNQLDLRIFEIWRRSLLLMFFVANAK